MEEGEQGSPTELSRLGGSRNTLANRWRRGCPERVGGMEVKESFGILELQEELGHTLLTPGRMK